MHGEGWLYKEFISIAQFLIVTLTLCDEFMATLCCLDGSFFSIRAVLPGKSDVLGVATDLQVKTGKQADEGGKGLLFKFRFLITSMPTLLVYKQAAPLSLRAHQLFFFFHLAKLIQQV